MISKNSIKTLIKQLQNSQKQPIFSQFGIGTEKHIFERNKPIFQKKAYSDPKTECPRDFSQHIFPEENFINFKVQHKNNNLDLCTYRYPQYHNKKSQQNKTPKGVIYMFHGMHGHTNQAGHVAEAFSDQGYVVMGFDHRGNGKSQGSKGLVGSIDDHLNDSNRFIEITSEIYDEKLPRFVVGLSMGGMTSYLISHLKKDYFKGTVMFAPALMPMNNTVDQKLSHFLASLIPAVPFLPPNIYASNRIKEICEKLAKEEHNQRNIFLKPGTASSIFKGMEMCNTSFDQFSTPFLVIQGGIDKLVDPYGPKLLLEKSPIQDKQLIWYDHMWHDIYHEPEITEIIPQVTQWVKERT